MGRAEGGLPTNSHRENCGWKRLDALAECNAPSEFVSCKFVDLIRTSFVLVLSEAVLVIVLE